MKVPVFVVVQVFNAEGRRNDLVDLPAQPQVGGNGLPDLLARDASIVVGICVGSEVGWPLSMVTTPRDFTGTSGEISASAGVFRRENSARPQSETRQTAANDMMNGGTRAKV